MPKIHIVTDSSANFIAQNLIKHHDITVVPNTVTVAGREYVDGEEISGEDALGLIRKYPESHRVQSPTPEAFAQVFASLATRVDAIVSIHPSRELYPSWRNAKIAAQQIMGSCEVVVIDSQTLCVAQGMLVQIASRALKEGTDLDELIRRVRGAVERVYSIYAVDSLDFLLRSGIMTPAHSVLGSMLHVKPFLAMEEGRLVTIEKVKTRHQMVERMVEFAVEFTDLIDVAIVQNRAAGTEQTRSLQERLLLEFPRQPFIHTVYNPALATLIGVDAFGVVVLEDEMEGFPDDDFED